MKLKIAAAACVLVLSAPACIHAQTSGRPAYIKSGQCSSSLRFICEKQLDAAKDAGLHGMIIPDPENDRKLFVLIGPYSSRPAFDAGMKQMTDNVLHILDDAPYYYLAPEDRATAGEPKAKESQPAAKTVQAGPSDEDTLQWLREFANERERVSYEGEELEFYTDSVVWRENCPPGWWTCHYSLMWSSVRKITLDNEGIHIFGTVNGCGNYENNQQGCDVVDRQQWIDLKFGSRTSTDDYRRALKAMTHLAELAGANMNSNNVF